MMPAMTIRPAQPADAATIADFQCRLARETEGMELDPATVNAGVRAVFEDPHRGTYYVAEAEGRVIGCLLTVPEWSDWRNGTVLWIHSLYIHPDWRRRGVYRAMYEHLRSRVLADPRLCGLRLYVDRRNTPAQQTYTALGMDGEHYQLFEWMKG